MSDTDFSSFIISKMDDSDYLSHHGVKGMHWGVRKADNRRVVEKLKKKKSKLDTKKIKYDMIAAKEHKKYMKSMAGYSFGLFRSGESYARKWAKYDLKSAKVSKKSFTTQAKINALMSELEKVPIEEKLKHTDIDDTFLEHHGIKGQKWGVRRTPEELGYKVGKDYLKISANDQNAKGGVSHVSTNKKVKPNKNSKLYVYNQSNSRDKEVYEGAYSEYLRRTNRNAKIYSNKYRLNSDIYAATQEAQEKKFSKLYKEDADIKRVTDLAEAYLTNRGWYDNESVKKNAGGRINDSNYRKFLAFNSDCTWGAKHPEIANVVNKYIDSFSKEGFNALVDTNNAKIYNGADTPLVIINGRETLTRTGMTKIPISLVNANLEAIKKRQGGSIALAEEDFGSIKFVDMDAYIAHHGIKGRGESVRRTPEQLGYKKIKTK